MLPWRQAMRNSSAPAMREIAAAPLPAALISTRDRTVPLDVCMANRAGCSEIPVRPTCMGAFDSSTSMASWR